MSSSFWKAQLAGSQGPFLGPDTCAGAAGSRRAEAAAVSSPKAFPEAPSALQLVPLLCPQLGGPGGMCSVSSELSGAAQSVCEEEQKMLIV